MAGKITTIGYTLKFNVDNSGLQQARQQLSQLSNITMKDLSTMLGTKATKTALTEVKQAATAVGTALETSLNPKLGTVNIQKFNSSLASTGMNIKQVQIGLNQAGTQGKIAFNNLTAQVLTTKRAVAQTSNFMKSMGTTFFNTLKWTAASSAISMMTRSVTQAWNYAKELDTSLNNIRIVTEKSAEEMEKFAKSANKAAKGLGAATTEYTDAALIYYQQGLDGKDVEARAEVTLKAANVTGQSAKEVSEQLTAVWNGYKVAANEAEVYIDKLAAVAASTASDLQELSEGMQKVASGANAMGVDIDQLTAALSTTISATRLDAAAVGTAFKTIFARMGDLQVDGIDEFGVKLGDVSGKLKMMGIDVLDQEGNLRDMGTVIEEVGNKWGTWTEAQQQAAAVALAGKRQYNNLLALFENWDKYMESKETSKMSEGTLEKQQQIYMDSIEAHLQQLSTAGERVYDSLFDSSSMKDMLDVLAAIVDKVADFVDLLGGGGNLLLMIGGVLAKTFSGSIAMGITRMVNNFVGYRSNLQMAVAEQELLNQYQNASGEAIHRMVGYKRDLLNYGHLMSEEEKESLNGAIRRTAEIDNQIQLEKERYQMAQQYAKDSGNKSLLNLGDKSAATALENEGNQIAERTAKFKKAAFGKEGGGKGYLLGKDDQTAILTAQHKAAGFDTTGFSGEAQAEFQKLNSELQQSGVTRARVVEIQNRMVELGEKEASAHQKAAQAIRDHKQREEELQRQMETINQETQALMKNVSGMRAAFNGLSTALGGIAQGVMGATMLVNAFKSLKDENLSTWDKLSQILMGISFGLPMVVTGAKSLVQGFVGVTGAIAGQNSMLGLNAALYAARTEQEKKGILMTMIEKNAKRALTNEEKEYLAQLSITELQENARQITQGKTITLNGVQVASNKAIEVSEKTKGNAGLVAGVKMWISGQLAKKGWWPFLLIALAIAAAIAAIIAVVALFVNGFKKAGDNGREAFKKATEEALKMDEVFKTAKEDFENLKKSITEIEDAKTALNDLTKGTEEWQEAVKKINEDVLSLLDKYPELASEITNVNGVLTVSQDGLDKLEEDAETNVNMLYRQSLVTKANAKLAENNMIAQQSADDYFKEMDLQKGAHISGMTFSPLYGAIGAGIGAIFGDAKLGATIAAGIVNPLAPLLGMAFAEGADGRRDAAYQAALDIMKEQGEDILFDEDKFTKLMKENGVTNEAYIDALLKNSTQLRENYLAIEANTLAIKTQQKEAAKNFLTDSFENWDNLTTQKQEALAEIYAVQVGEGSAAYNQEWAKIDKTGKYNDINKRDIFRYKDASGKDLAQQYAELMGYDVNDIKVQHNNTTFKSADGQQDIKVSNETLARAIVQENAYKNNLKLAEEAERAFDKIRRIAGSSISGFVAGKGSINLDQLNQIEITKLSGATQSKNALATYLGYSSLEEMETDIQALGYKSAEKYIEAIKKSAEEYNRKSTALLWDFSAIAGKEFNKLSKISGNWALETKETVLGALDFAYEQAGEGAAQQLRQLLSSGKLTEQQVLALSNAISSIPWRTGNAVAEITNALDSAGVSTDALGENWDNFVETIAGSVNVIQDVVSNIKTIATTLKEIGGTIDDLSLGTVIEEEDYERLVKYNAKLKEFFILTSEGYTYLGGGEGELKKALSGALSAEVVKDDFDTAQTLGNNLISGGFFKKDSKTNEVTFTTGYFDENTQEALSDEKYSKLFKASGLEQIDYIEARNILAGNEKLTINGKEMAIADIQGKKVEDLAQEIFEKDWGSLSESQKANLNTLVTTADDRYAGAQRTITNVGSTILSSLNSISQGEWEKMSKDAQTLAVSSQYKTYDELKRFKFNDTKGSQYDTEEYFKLANLYLAQEAEALDFNAAAWEAYSKSVLENGKESMESLFKKEQALNIIRQKAMFDELDMYSDLDLALDKQERILDILNEKQETLIEGSSDWANNLDDQIKTIKEQMKLEEERVEKQKEELYWRRQALNLNNSALEDYGTSIEYNEDGSVKDDTINKIREAYLKEDDETKREMLSGLLDDLASFNEDLFKIEDEGLSAIYEGYQKIIDLNAEKFEKTIEMKLDLDEALREWEKFKQEFKLNLFDDGKMSISEFFDESLSDTIKNSLSTYESYRNSFATIDRAIQDSANEFNKASTGKFEESTINDLKEQKFQTEQELQRIKEVDLLKLNDEIAILEKERTKIEKETQTHSMYDYINQLEQDVNFATLKLEEAKEKDKERLAEYFNNFIYSENKKLSKNNINENTQKLFNDFILARKGENYAEYKQKRKDFMTSLGFDQIDDMALQNLASDYITKGFNFSQEYDAAVTNLENIKTNLKSAKEQAEDLDLTIEADHDFKKIEEFNDAIRSKKDAYKDKLKEAKDKLYGSDDVDSFDMLIEEAKEARQSAMDTLDINRYLSVSDGIISINENAYKEDIDGYLEEAQSMLESMREEINTIYETYLSAQEQLMEAYDSQIEKISSVNGLLENQANLLKLIGKNSTSYSNTLKGIYEANRAYSKQSLEIAQEQLKQAYYQYEDVMRLRDDASKEMINTVTENLKSAMEQVMTLSQEYATAIADEFSAKMTVAIDDYFVNATGKDLAALTEAWEFEKNQDEKYLDPINAAYERDKLNRQISKSIDETDNYAAQNKLIQMRAEQEEKLNKIIAERGKLSQYDLDRANAQYELTLKQIALEEAQQTASKLKLTRDLQGNYTYEYVADEDKVADAEQALADAQNKLYNLDKDRNKELVDEYYSIMQEANEKMAEAIAADDQERLAELKELYFGDNGLITLLQSELRDANENFGNIGSTLGGADWTSFIDKFSDPLIQSELGDLATVVSGIADTAGGNLKDVVNLIDGLLNNENSVLMNAMSSLKNTIQTAEEISKGSDVTEVLDASKEALAKLPSLVQDVTTLAKKLDAFGTDYYKFLEEDVDAQAEALLGNTAALNSLKNAVEKWSGLDIKVIQDENGNFSIVLDQEGDTPLTE